MRVSKPGDRAFAAMGSPDGALSRFPDVSPASGKPAEFASPEWFPDFVSVFSEYFEILVTFGRVVHSS
jgi:hypothetical protein